MSLSFLIALLVSYLSLCSAILVPLTLYRHHFSLPALPITPAVDVLTSGTYSQLPACVKVHEWVVFQPYPISRTCKKHARVLMIRSQRTKMSRAMPTNGLAKQLRSRG